ncbi:unnamed protein product [Cylindrotheca closterium]|uniref:DUF6787 domain-containing protein n=1 Tax=Cylindrotheca closterium TaxID=2856 RepID=A0AAD2CHR1_9STRA|nr:unnamed protein product [Cylindrotheca closterium]
MASMLGMNLRKVALGAMEAPLGIRAVQKRASSFHRRLETPSQRGFPPLMMRNGTDRRFIKTSSATKTTVPEPQGIAGFWQRFIGPKPMPERWTAAWYREVTLICTVFAITGSSTMVLVRPAVSKGLALEGSMKEGPWSYRICSIVIMTPIYATLLVMVGTLFGRHHYFRHFSVKMWSRFGIPPEMLDATFHETKKTFRKW